MRTKRQKDREKNDMDIKIRSGQEEERAKEKDRGTTKERSHVNVKGRVKVNGHRQAVVVLDVVYHIYVILNEFFIRISRGRSRKRIDKTTKSPSAVRQYAIFIGSLEFHANIINNKIDTNICI